MHCTFSALLWLLCAILLAAGLLHCWECHLITRKWLLYSWHAEHVCGCLSFCRHKVSHWWWTVQANWAPLLLVTSTTSIYAACILWWLSAVVIEWPVLKQFNHLWIWISWANIMGSMASTISNYDNTQSSGNMHSNWQVACVSSFPIAWACMPGYGNINGNWSFYHWLRCLAHLDLVQMDTFGVYNIPVSAKMDIWKWLLNWKKSMVEWYL